MILYEIKKGAVVKNKSSTNSSDIISNDVAKNIVNGINDLQNEIENQQNFAENKNTAEDKNGVKADSELYNPPNQHKSTLFMLNNNEPQPQSFEPYLKDIPAYQKSNSLQLTSYGTAAVVLAIITLICSVFLILPIAINPDMTDTSKMDFFFYLFFVILAPAVGLIGSVLCGLASALLGIVAIFKSHKRTISWVGFSLGIIVLAYVVILAGIYLLG